MRKSWAMATMAVLMVSVGMVKAQAEDDYEARLAMQCPSIVPWMKAEDAREAAREAHAITPSEPALHDELIKMGHDDQGARNAIIADNGKHPELWKTTQVVDVRNLLRIKQIDSAQGFPTPAQVGYDGMQAAFLLVQHADSDPAFQAHVLGELKSRPDHGIGGRNYAYLTDRVLAAQRKPQRYGTQFEPFDKTGAGGKLVPKPIEDAANVDKRRADVGLPSMADYECMMRVEYRIPAKP